MKKKKPKRMIKQIIKSSNKNNRNKWYSSYKSNNKKRKNKYKNEQYKKQKKKKEKKRKNYKNKNYKKKTKNSNDENKNSKTCSLFRTNKQEPQDPNKKNDQKKATTPEKRSWKACSFSEERKHNRRKTEKEDKNTITIKKK